MTDKPNLTSAERNNGAGRDPIAEGLRRIYDDTLREPLPEPLARLLDRLQQTAHD